jgi:hypothetical protein
MAEPRTYAFATWLFLRLLGFIYLIAFASLATQIKGLAGREGILPASEVLEYRDRGKISRFWRLPTLCWLSTSDRFLLFLCWGGAVLGGLLTAGFAPVPTLILLWAFYLSLFNVCRLFLGYQWDVLLLETGFLAIFLAPAQLWSRVASAPPPSPLIIWLLWWLLFRLMFSSGFVKLRSGDKAWRSLTALRHHYETQPLPTPAAWYAHQLPKGIHRISTAAVLLIELVGPVFILGPPCARHAVCGSFIILMFLIELTGNYAFFNLLGVALSLLLLDDQIWRSALQRFMSADLINHQISAMDAPGNKGTNVLAVVLLLISCDVIAKLFHRPIAWPRLLTKGLEFLAPFHLVSSYGLFAVITTERPEINIEGSYDGVNWMRYEFKWKPGAVQRAPCFVAPHQPRLDWQMWFAALGYCETNPWIVRFMVRVLEGSESVLGLLNTNPFLHKPPRYIRASLYDYRFASLARRKASRAWWIAERRGTYCPALEATDPQVNIAR